VLVFKIEVKEGITMADLNGFLQKNVEGYLFEDLRTMKAASPAPSKQEGAVGYPLLMSAFAGIELLGALLSPTEFDKDNGSHYFSSFWKDYLYSGDPCRAAAGNTLYKLARHGLAHVYVTKGDISVCKGDPTMHLVRALDGSICVDAAQLADDLEHCYNSKVKPLVTGSGAINGASMSMRLGEMEAAYRAQAAQLLVALQLPSAPAWTTSEGPDRACQAPGPLQSKSRNWCPGS
jgi:hypothetical protein